MTDNTIARHVLVKQLERHDLKVTATTNGQEAVQGETHGC